MRDTLQKWSAALGASACGFAIWLLAARHGYAWETLWLPAALIATAWPRAKTRTRCRLWPRKEDESI
jgi:hypothetical protein